MMSDLSRVAISVDFVQAYGRLGPAHREAVRPVMSALQGTLRSGTMTQRRWTARTNAGDSDHSGLLGRGPPFNSTGKTIRAGGIDPLGAAYLWRHLE